MYLIYVERLNTTEATFPDFCEISYLRLHFSDTSEVFSNLFSELPSPVFCYSSLEAQLFM